ncbi:hypothetical protein IP84_01310 [beta proteobacterium AAP99]|nr:hypothetical protein IP84_01310 [beta proteobacterium AAP99]
MDLAALLLALLIEQAHAMPANNPVWASFRGWSAWFAKNFNAGAKSHGRLAWVLYAAGVGVGVTLIWWGATKLHPALGFAVNVIALLFTMGFRRFSHAFTLIEDAVREGDADAAYKVMAQWRAEQDRPLDVPTLPLHRSAALAIEDGLVASHRSVFGVMFWFAVLPGPVGAVLYRLTDHIARHWSRPHVGGDSPEDLRFSSFARQAFEVIDWVPARLSALGFAIVGNFEDAMHLWRNRALRFGEDTRALLVAAGAGALGVEIGPPGKADSGLDWSGTQAGAAAMRSAAGLAWRTAILWLTIIAVWTVAQLFG